MSLYCLFADVGIPPKTQAIKSNSTFYQKQIQLLINNLQFISKIKYNFLKLFGIIKSIISRLDLTGNQGRFQDRVLKIRTRLGGFFKALVLKERAVIGMAVGQKYHTNSRPDFLNLDRAFQDRVLNIVRECRFRLDWTNLASKTGFRYDR
jgi:hypothetical protein